jgi:hypothetical protein
MVRTLISCIKNGNSTFSSGSCSWLKHKTKNKNKKLKHKTKNKNNELWNFYKDYVKFK